MPTAARTTPLREPRQARSRRTLERVLVATERLLDDRPFEAITVQEIVRTAGTSVGAFYTRFADKQALLPSLYQRYDHTLGERLAALESDDTWRDLDLPRLAPRIVAHFVAVFRERRHLMRALAIYARTHPTEIDAGTRAHRRRQVGFLFGALLRHRDRIRHPDPERAVELAVYFVVSACRDRVLFAESTHAASTGLDDAELTAELARMMLGYLCVDPSKYSAGTLETS